MSSWSDGPTRCKKKRMWKEAGWTRFAVRVEDAALAVARLRVVVPDSGFRVYGLWFRVYGLWFGVWGFGLRVYGLWFMV